MDFPDEVGVIVLPQTTLFPHNLLPLYIFEPRYRKMVARALESHRMFGVALSRESDEPCMIGGVGLIRACVQNDDGTSNLVLQGVARVRFTEWTSEAPYFIGKISSLTEEQDCNAEICHDCKELSDQLINEVRRIQIFHDCVPDQVYSFLEGLEDFDMLADIISGNFVNDAQRRQELLEIRETSKRMELLIATLGQEYRISEEGGTSDTFIA